MSISPGSSRARLRLLGGKRAPGDQVRTVHLALVCALWIAIIWLLFASLVARPGADGQVNQPTRGQGRSSGTGPAH